MVCSSSLILRELHNPYLETRGEVLLAKNSKCCCQSQETRRYGTTVFCLTPVWTTQLQAKTLGPQPTLPVSIFPVAFGQMSRSAFPLFSKLLKAPQANQAPAKDCSLFFAKFPLPRSAPSLHFLKTFPRSCPKSGTPGPLLDVASAWHNSCLLIVLS